MTVSVDVAAPQDLAWIAALEREHYGPMRAVAQARIEEWYAANPGGFLILRDGTERCGHVTLLPLRPQTIRALLDGSKSENEIEGHDLFGPAERAEVREIYVESVVARPLDLFAELVRTFEQQVARIADPALVEALYLAPLAAEGALLAANLRFQPTSRMYRVDRATLIKRTSTLRETLERRRLS